MMAHAFVLRYLGREWRLPINVSGFATRQKQTTTAALGEMIFGAKKVKKRLHTRTPLPARGKKSFEMQDLNVFDLDTGGIYYSAPLNQGAASDGSRASPTGDTARQSVDLAEYDQLNDEHDIRLEHDQEQQRRQNKNKLKNTHARYPSTDDSMQPHVLPTDDGHLVVTGKRAVSLPANYHMVCVCVQIHYI